MSQSFWTPTTDATGYRRPLASEDYPNRETALAIMSALDRIEEGSWSELERLSGVDKVAIIADRYYMVYGYPELEPATMSRRMSDVFMRPRKAPPQEAAVKEFSTVPKPRRN